MVMSTLPPLPLPEEMRQWDEASFALGLPEVMLMENASRAALRALEDCGVPLAGRRVWLFMGGGNNGGDAAALARHLLDAGAQPTVWHTRPLGQYRGACGQHVRMARRCGVSFLPVGRCLAGDGRKGQALPHVVVDGLLGTGFHGELRPDMLALVRRINALRREAFVLSLDVPSGLDAASGRPLPEAVRAHATVTFEAAKFGLVLPESVPFTGRLLILPIGIPLAVRRTAPCSARLLSADVLGHLPPFRPQGYKNSYGHVLVVGGAEDLCGAAHLAARAALRAGAGLTSALVPCGNGLAVRNGLAEIMVREMPGSAPGLWPSLPSGNLRLLLEGSVDRVQALVIGPGMGRGEAAQTLLRALLSCPQRPSAVLDADALVLLSREPELLRALREQDVLTPHPGEAAALLGTTAARVQADRRGALRALCALTPACVVLKGAGTLIGQQRGQRLRPVCVSPWDVPALAVGGSGDVLAGCMGALLARRAAHPAATPEEDCPVDVLTLAAVGVSWHALAGRAVAGQYPTRGNLAHELADVLPSVHAAHGGCRPATGDGRC
ncbi:NAD(P)H-hydrate dehydratase [uncultured Desulfovibrio sp.]|uniref:NAD(P)H-hydrate dehydratase n=3 Tax=uncultured Desulfovibrio sp. TaxID=167968 RepID=UPI0025EC4354|nr:NAD(P)H-hydrate dehydratase [uncultured Desulfovibrio sp.]